MIERIRVLVSWENEWNTLCVMEKWVGVPEIVEWRKKYIPEFRRCVMYDNGSMCNLDLKIMV